jgi:hypothetical protein
MLRHPGAINEEAGEQAQCERAGDVDDEGSVGESIAEQPGRGDVDAVAERAADPGADEDDEVKHKPPTAARMRL